MKYCVKCVMPDTRPGIKFNEEGVCSACIAAEVQKKVNWSQRMEELKVLCDKYRGMNGNSWDCAVAVSGGKDSHFQVYVMKELMGMNPILFSVEDNFTMTEAGKYNVRNISEEFGCNIISLKPDIRTQKKIMRKTFEEYGKPTWFIDRLIYTFPLHMAQKFNTPLLVYGENISLSYGGEGAVETYSAKNQIKNGVASDIPWKVLVNAGITEKEMSLTIPPDKDIIDSLEPIYLSYFIEWNSYKNYIFAKSRGFKDLTHEWDRTQHIENFDQVDSYAYLVHPWLKYPKFGHTSATDYASRYVRCGKLTREEAVKLVKEKDAMLDPKCVDDFCQFTGYSRSEFWKIIDKMYNQDVFKKNEYGEWVLREPLK